MLWRTNNKNGRKIKNDGEQENWNERRIWDKPIA